MWFLENSITFEYLVIRILVILCIVFMVFPIKQYFYAYAANKFGDDTPRLMGKLTVNPYVHFDLIGSLCILLFGIGWPKDVLVNTNNFKNVRRDSFLLAMTAPLTHIGASIFGVVMLGISRIFLPLWAFHSFAEFTSLYVYLNVMFAAYEFLPIDPFKGFLIFQAILPEKILEGYRKNYHIISIIFWLLLVFGMFSGPLNFLQKMIYNFIVKITIVIGL